jgi:hypothetical protein
MKKVIGYVFLGLYVLFQAVVWLFYTPATLFDAFGALVGPAAALWVIFWTNVKAGEGLVGMFRRNRTSTDEATRDR